MEEANAVGDQVAGVAGVAPQRTVLYLTECTRPDYATCPCAYHALYRDIAVMDDHSLLVAIQHYPTGPYHAPFEGELEQCPQCERLMSLWHRWTWGFDCTCEFCEERKDQGLDRSTDSEAESDDDVDVPVIPPGLTTFG